MKQVRTPAYNYNFNEETGYFERWGKDINDDPQYSPIGPERLDISVSSICHQNCEFFYQSNSPDGKNMSLDTFKSIIDKMPMLTQIAIATGDIEANPDIWNMMEYSRRKNIVPNITISGYRLSDEAIDKLAKYAGAVAVSNYSEDVCFNTVYKLNEAGIDQVNIHQLLSDETLSGCFSVLEKYSTDSRLSRLNAIVFLSLKRKGRGIKYHKANDEDYKKLINYGLENNIPIGFDSCGCSRFIDVIKDRKDFQHLVQFCEFCEASLFSSFINVDGMYSPCSFMEGKFKSISVLRAKDFLQDVWYNIETNSWREKLLSNCRNCPIYDV
jgi:MoaA/NifB/PqqE/SkfB family radical SAM enzyme